MSRTLRRVTGALCLSMSAFAGFIAECANLAAHPHWPAWAQALNAVAAIVFLFGAAAFAALALVTASDSS